jgi:hypothetical protein
MIAKRVRAGLARARSEGKARNIQPIEALWLALLWVTETLLAAMQFGRNWHEAAVRKCPLLRAREGRNGDQHDGYCIAAWLSRADREGSLAAFLKPDLTPPERAVAQVEGWILGVPGLIRAGRESDDPASPTCNPCMSSLH